MLSIVRRNFGLKVFAFALALAAWAYFHYSASPSITARFDQPLSVPIIVTGLRPGYVARYADKFAIVTIEEPRTGPPIKTEQVKAVLNLSKNPDAGVFNVPIEIIAPNLQIRSLAPASVTLTIDRIEERSVPIAIDYSGSSHNIVVESAAVNPSSVVLRGSATDLERVHAVRVAIGLPGKPLTFDAMIRPVASDTRGEEVGSVQVSPNLVRVRARFVLSTGTGAQ